MAKETTIVLPCICEHEYQDQLYGKGKRLHNVSSKGEAFCTVCCPSNRRNKESGRPNRKPKKTG